MAIKENREYRAMVEMRAKDDANYIVEGYATTFDDPYVMYEDGDKQYKECISRDALNKADMSDILFLYNHEGRVFARQKNGTLKVECDEHGVRVWADLSKTEQARSIYEDIKSGMIDQMSWAFTVDADEYDKSTCTRTITKVRKVYDVSAVSIPANPATEISARSYFNGVIESEKAERLEREKAKLRLKLKLSEV